MVWSAAALACRQVLPAALAKLAGALGLWLGWQGVPLLFLLAAGSGLIAVLIYSGLLRRKITGDTPIPFGPWIALSGWICWLLLPL